MTTKRLRREPATDCAVRLSLLAVVSDSEVGVVIRGVDGAIRPDAPTP